MEKYIGVYEKLTGEIFNVWNRNFYKKGF
jgi:hypothetical protein